MNLLIRAFRDVLYGLSWGVFVVIVCAVTANAAANIQPSTSYVQLTRGSSLVTPAPATMEECESRKRQLIAEDEPKKTRGQSVYTCSTVVRTVVTFTKAVPQPSEPPKQPEPTQPKGWKIAQDFDDKAAGSSCGWDAGGGSTVSSEQAYSGGKSCRLSVRKGDTAFGTWGGIIEHPRNLRRGDELWVRLRTYMPAGFNYNSIGEGYRLKFLRVHTMSDRQPNFGYNDWYINPKGSRAPFSYIYEGEQVWSDIGAGAIEFGKWETWEYYLKLDTAPVAKGGQARVKLWKNGVLLADIKDRITLATADGFADRTHLFTYWNGGAPLTQSMYVDDIVLTTDAPAGRDAAGNAFIGQ